MKSKKTQYLSFMAMFLAIEIVLVITPLGYLPIGPISATTMHIPVIIAGIVLGKKAGAQLGFVFGLTSVINATFRPLPTSFVFTPFISIGGMSGNWLSLVIAFVPRILLGFLAGYVYEVLQKKKVNDNISIIISALCGALTNTILVLSGIYLFFGNDYASVAHIAYKALMGVLLGVVTTNGIVEAILGAFACLLVCKAIKPITKKFDFK
ncbi:MAG: ECF transporter S component [Longicatena sp.]